MDVHDLVLTPSVADGLSGKSGRLGLGGLARFECLAGYFLVLSHEINLSEGTSFPQTG